MELLRISQAAERAGVSRPTIYAAIKRGDLIPVIAAPIALLDAAKVEEWGKGVNHIGGRPRKKATE